jgi:hypothetical protein
VAVVLALLRRLVGGRFRMVAIPVVAALAGGCVGGSAAEPGTDLTILYERAPHITMLDRLTLTCDPAGGSLPNPSAACRAIHADPNRFVGKVKAPSCIGGVVRWSVTVSGHLDTRRVSHTYDECDYPQARAWTDLGGTKLIGVVPASSPEALTAP